MANIGYGEKKRANATGEGKRFAAAAARADSGPRLRSLRGAQVVSTAWTSYSATRRGLLVMSRGLLIADGDPEQVRADPDVQAAYFGDAA